MTSFPLQLPDFVIIGAMKSGTSTLQVQLAGQPGVFMTTPKEPNFFSNDDVYAQGLGWYNALFSDAKKGDLKGEASTHYTKLPTYPDTLTRMQKVLRRPKLIYVLRNPVDRALSHYIHEWSMGNMGKDPIAAFRQHKELVSYGCYGLQIAPFVTAFGPQQIYLTSLEQLKQDPDLELKNIGRHLNAPDPFIWNHDLQAQNVSAERVRKRVLDRVLIDNPVAKTARRILVPKAVRNRIRAARTYGDRPQLPDDLRQKLQDQFLQDRAVLAGFFPDHPALTACYPFHPEGA